MAGRSMASSADGRYQFTSKERDAESGLDYFGARYYDSWRGQWISVDPLLEKYPNLSPYNYTADNPIRLFDPDGGGILDYLYGVGVAIVRNMVPIYNGTDVSSYSGNKTDYAAGRVMGDITSQYIGNAEVDAGTGGEAVGAVETATGVGAGPGVVTVAASAALQAHGAMTATVATVNLAKDMHTLQNENTNESTNSGGQTYNGRPTDEHGNVLGGSGESRQYTTQHSTRKGAKDAARNKGKSAPAKHTSSKNGRPDHFHAADQNGEKIPNSTHHEYPQ